jgi:tetratricopeptide (TPR) repeat protein
MERPPESPASRDGLLSVVLRVGDRPVEARLSTGEDALDDVPFGVQARRSGDGWRVEGPDGAQAVGGEDSPVALEAGAVRAEVSVVRRERHRRFGWVQGDAVLPLLSAALGVLLLQLSLLRGCVSAVTGGGAPGAPEPTPEFIARLLEEQFDGAEQGVLAKPTERPATGQAIRNYYLPSGHAGPTTRMGGGRNRGPATRDGSADGGTRATPRVPPRGQEPLPQAVPAATPADALAKERGDDQPIAVHVNEGWGLTDWYDTQDAREDAHDIEDKLRFARQLLRIDPDDAYALSVRAYYEYLAMDYKAARRTYERFTTLFPEDAAGWNNLALVYKREKRYAEEEALYRKALELDPMDDHAINNLAVCLAHQGRTDEALVLMEQLDTLVPGDAYAELHRAKIYAIRGETERAYRSLELSLTRMAQLDTLHNIEFRQDIRIDPAFETLRKEDRFRGLLNRFYGNHAAGWWNRKGGRAAPPAGATP